MTFESGHGQKCNMYDILKANVAPNTQVFLFFKSDMVSLCTIQTNKYCASAVSDTYLTWTQHSLWNVHALLLFKQCLVYKEYMMPNHMSVSSSKLTNWNLNFGNGIWQYIFIGYSEKFAIVSCISWEMSTSRMRMREFRRKFLSCYI